jgi:hypothetical protein
MDRQWAALIRSLEQDQNTMLENTHRVRSRIG